MLDMGSIWIFDPGSKPVVVKCSYHVRTLGELKKMRNLLANHTVQ